MQGSTSGFLEVVYNSRVSNVGNTSQLNTRLLMSQRWWARDIDTPGKNPWLVSKNIRSQINKHSLCAYWPTCFVIVTLLTNQRPPSWEESKRRLRSSTAAFWKTLRNIFLAVIRVQYNCTGNSKVKSFTLRIKRLTLNQRNIYYITMSVQGKGQI